MRRRRLLTALLAAGTGGCLQFQEGDDSTGAPGENTVAETDRRTETTPERDYDEPRWTFAAGSALQVLPVVVGDTVVTGSEDGTLYGLDRTDGTTVWEASNHPVADNRWRPHAVDGTVLFSTHDETLAVEAATGEIQWQLDFGGRSRVALGDDTVFIEGGEYGTAVTAHDLATGAQQWRQEPDHGLGGARSTAICDGVVVTADQTDLFALDAATGERVWRYEAPKAETEIVDCTTDGTSVFATYRNATVGGAGPLVALAPEDGTERWTQYEAGETLSNGGSAAPYLRVHDGTLYVSHTGLHAVSPDDGLTKWFNTDISPSVVTPVDGTLYAGASTWDGVVLLAIDDQSGRVTDRIESSYAEAWGRRPAVANGTAILVESAEAGGNRLTAYDLGE